MIHVLVSKLADLEHLDEADTETEVGVVGQNQ